MKPLSQLLEEIDIGPWEKTPLVDRASYDRMKRVAIELAKALETLSVAVNDKVEDNGATNFCLRAITRAKDIIGGG